MTWTGNAALRLALVALIIVAGAGCAERNLIAWPDARRPLAKTISDVGVASAIALRTVDSLRSDNKLRAFGCQGLQLGTSSAVSLLAKTLVHRDRPNHLNNRSFFSGHSAQAASMSRWNYSIGMSIAVGTGYLRGASNYHFQTDIGTGLLVGWLSSRVCR